MFLSGDCSVVYAELVQEKKKENLDKIKNLMAEVRLSPEEIAQHLGLPSSASIKKSSTKEGREKAPPKYKEPNGERTWNGRGKKPTFIVEYEKNGGSKEDLLIQKPA